jgi:cardiolipin synthase A/B
MDWSTQAVLAYVLYVILLIAALFIVPRNRKPSEATAWLTLIFLIPLLGLVLFLLLGNPKLSWPRRVKQREMDDIIARTVAEFKHRPELHDLLDPPIAPRFLPFTRLNEHLSGIPAFAGNAVTLLPDYDGALRSIVEEIEQAQTFVHVEYYILALDKTSEPFFAALERATERGVKVRVLFDHLGSLTYPHYRRMTKRLTAAGAEWHLALPARIFDNEWSRLDLRNHRKIVIVDGLVGFTGSQNMIDKSYLSKQNLKKGRHYVELVARATGPIVAQLQAAFATDWYSETGVLLDRAVAPEVVFVPSATGTALCQVLPSGPGFDNDNNLKLFVALLHAAQRRIMIATPYFVPDDSLMIAITSAAQRGVDVTLIVSEIGDQFLVFHAQRSYYEELLLAGVKILLYRAPEMLHSKFLCIDDDIAVVGSSNLDLRSFQLNLEVTLICYDTGIVADMQGIFADYVRSSKPLGLDEWQARPIATRLFDNVARLTSALQ